MMNLPITFVDLILNLAVGTLPLIIRYQILKRPLKWWWAVAGSMAMIPFVLVCNVVGLISDPLSESSNSAKSKEYTYPRVDILGGTPSKPSSINTEKRRQIGRKLSSGIVPQMLWCFFILRKPKKRKSIEENNREQLKEAQEKGLKPKNLTTYTSIIDPSQYIKKNQSQND